MRHSQAGFDVARGLAALIVFMAHICQMFFWPVWGADSWPAHASSYAAQGAVAVFFVLSGYLITQSIQQNVKRNGIFDAGAYTASRITRIYPPLIGSIGVCVVVWAIIHGLGLPAARATLHPGEIGRALTMQDGMLDINGPLWSLFVEFRLYLVALAVACWWRGTGLARAPASILAIWAIMALKPQVWWCLIWALGSLTAVLGWRVPGGDIPWPKWLTATGSFSYSLYVLHFPLILLALALSLNWAVAAVLILAITIPFARVTENQRYFKALLSK